MPTNNLQIIQQLLHIKPSSQKKLVLIEKSKIRIQHLLIEQLKKSKPIPQPKLKAL